MKIRNIAHGIMITLLCQSSLQSACLADMPPYPSHVPPAPVLQEKPVIKADSDKTAKPATKTDSDQTTRTSDRNHSGKKKHADTKTTASKDTK
jgi:hypothetical protein